MARHFGFNQSAIVKWVKKAKKRGYGAIPTESSRPKTSPRALKRDVVEAIIEKRSGRKRCGQVVHQELLRDGVRVSLSSVQRTLERCNLLKKRSPWKRPHDATPRPEAAYAGALLETDTVHILAPDGSRIYVYTIIDLYSRWAYAEAVEKIGADASVQFVRRAAALAPFPFEVVQSDHGSEFSIWFTHMLWSMNILHRHSRVRQKNDQAHIERFNRTIQEECLDHTAHTVFEFQKALAEYMRYYNSEHLHMGINYSKFTA